MKKKGFTLISLLVVLIMAGCSLNKPVTKTYVEKMDGITREIRLDGNSGDELLKYTMKLTIPYSAIGTTNKIEAEKLVSNNKETYEQVPGLTQTYDYSDSYLVETLVLDLQEGDAQEFNRIGAIELDNSEADGVSLLKTEDGLIDEGFKLKEE